MIKLIIKKLLSILDTTQLGFYYICLIFSTGFFFYFSFLFYLLGKLIPISIFKNLQKFFQDRQKNPITFLTLVLIFFMGVFLHTYLYVDENEIKYVDNEIIQKTEKESVEETKTIEESETTTNTNNPYTKTETNLYRRYGKMDLSEIDFSQLKKVNNQVVAWIMVDGTNINYPIVQTDNNDYYLNHDIMHHTKTSGWVFMDYRNSIDLSDNNTIIYGHNLLNKTAFGSLSNVFTDNWYNNSNHYIVIQTETGKHVYQVFSCYYIDPEIYYLQNSFYDLEEYQTFLNKLVERSIYPFNLELTTSDKIITLSTCTDDNKGRRVVHAKMIE